MWRTDHGRARGKLGSQAEAFAMLSAVDADGWDTVMTAMKVVREETGPKVMIRVKDDSNFWTRTIRKMELPLLKCRMWAGNKFVC